MLVLSVAGGESMILDPLVDLGLGHTDDILGGLGGSLAAANMEEIQAALSLVQVLLITGRIAQSAEGILLDQSGGFSIVLLLADDFLHGMNLLSDGFSYG